MLLDISVAVFVLCFIYVISWWIIRNTEENQTPIFHKENNIDSDVYDQELIYNEYVPDPDYMDKLEYSSFDLKKSSPIPRHFKAFSSDPFVSAKSLKKKRKI